VESHHVCHMDLVTVDEVYLETGIAGPDLETLDQATVDADQVIVDADLATGNLGPVTGNVRSPVASEIHGYSVHGSGLTITWTLGRQTYSIG